MRPFEPSLAGGLERAGTQEGSEHTGPEPDPDADPKRPPQDPGRGILLPKHVPLQLAESPVGCREAVVGQGEALERLLARLRVPDAEELVRAGEHVGTGGGDDIELAL